jgi:release factor glutamine methyltransferase
METPTYSHLTPTDYDHVYEPSEDSFLLIDALEQELTQLQSLKPLVTLEIGPGSGIVISALAKYLPQHSFYAVDINGFACDATKRTAAANKVRVEVINMDLLTAFKPNSVDLLLFNPPYVPTPSDESSIDTEAEETYQKESHEKMLIKSWAGGVDGCEIINRVVAMLDEILAPNGLFYLLLIKDNNPEKIRAKLKAHGYCSRQIIDRKIRGEHLLVLKISKNLL